MTYKEDFNKKYNQPKDKSNSLADIARLTKISKPQLQKIYNKGVGAFKNPGPSRPNMKKEQWAMARVYSAVMGGKAAKVDKNELAKGRGKKVEPKKKVNKENLRVVKKKKY
jgi:hypothetical protein